MHVTEGTQTTEGAQATEGSPAPERTRTTIWMHAIMEKNNSGAFEFHHKNLAGAVECFEAALHLTHQLQGSKEFIDMATILIGETVNRIHSVPLHDLTTMPTPEDDRPNGNSAFRDSGFYMFTRPFLMEIMDERYFYDSDYDSDDDSAFDDFDDQPSVESLESPRNLMMMFAILFFNLAITRQAQQYSVCGIKNLYFMTLGALSLVHDIDLLRFAAVNNTAVWCFETSDLYTSREYFNDLLLLLRKHEKSITQPERFFFLSNITSLFMAAPITSPAA
jgi:hypothetical protein